MSRTSGFEEPPNGWPQSGAAAAARALKPMTRSPGKLARQDEFVDLPTWARDATMAAEALRRPRSQKRREQAEHREFDSHLRSQSVRTAAMRKKHTNLLRDLDVWMMA